MLHAVMTCRSVADGEADEAWRETMVWRSDPWVRLRYCVAQKREERTEVR